ncbi:hypothetical protein BKA58DRAFT_194176 [Alternaria rosae]|uniref:uncharacterized protein n=1 Tax=Alternaria rosae TaxID=1187941 RepID=UPI001E8D1D7C|nr:uncharacterized protein BKA58DRAFT_194176 [Alternaria rosae]KAH6868384.1 hypothetical protein BKA58DRAFT_194176 [Alternaria rosae]
MVATSAASPANPFIDRYPESPTQPMKTVDTDVFFKNNDSGDFSCASNTVSAKIQIQQTVLGEPDVHWVPNFNWSPPSSHGSRASLSSMDDSSTAPSSPIADMDDPIEWNNGNLMYLLSILRPRELEADVLTFAPPLLALEDLRYPFHLQLYNKKRTLVAKSDTICSNPNLARRSIAHDLMSDHKFIDATIGKLNAVWAIHSSSVPTLKSMLRGMEEMMTVTDHEWQQRIYQLSGAVDGDCVGQCVDGECSIESRLEYYLLLKGRDALEDSIRCVGHVLGLDSDEERAKRADMFAEAGSFLGRAFEEMLAGA